jgi:hypothetical protein
MIKKTLFSITATVVLATAAQATVVNLGGSVTPVFPGADDFLGGAQVTIGNLTGMPASNATADIAAVFDEFGSYQINGGGFTPNQFDGGFASTDSGVSAPFNGRQIYIWVVDTADKADATGSAVFTGTGDAWKFPTHVGNGQDATSLPTDAADAPTWTFTYGAMNGDNSQMLLARVIPEPSGALLAGLGGALLVFRRRRK